MNPPAEAADGGGACLFCAIADGSQPASTVHEDGDVVAFLDVRPVFPGHVLVVPRAHVETLPELPVSGLEPLWGVVQRICVGVEAALEADGTFVAVNNRVSQSVPHLHVHVVPRRRKDGLRGFFWPRNPYEDDGHRDEVAQRIRSALVASGEAAPS